MEFKAIKNYSILMFFFLYLPLIVFNYLTAKVLKGLIFSCYLQCNGPIVDSCCLSNFSKFILK